MMLTTTSNIIGAATSIVFFVGVAFANHTEPAKAKKLQASLTNGYLSCDTPNTATQSANAPACTPAVPLGFCAFSASGSGKLTATVTGSAAKGNQDIKFSVAAKGLGAGCEGERLCVSLSVRYTNDDCPEGSCTSTDIQGLRLEGAPPSCCIVSGGVCKLETTLLTTFPGIVARGKNTGIQILTCGLKADTAPLNPPEIVCGLVLP